MEILIKCFSIEFSRNSLVELDEFDEFDKIYWYKLKLLQV